MAKDKTQSELLWVEFHQDYWTVHRSDKWETQGGLPHCVYERIHALKFDELQWIRCPSKSRNEKGQNGLT